MDISTLSRQTKSRSVLPVIAALWATGVALYFLLAPTYETSFGSYGPNTPASEVARTEVRGHASALEVNGPHILFVLSIPILLALSPLAIRKHRRAALLGAGALTLCFCILGALSVGTFYLPTALLFARWGDNTCGVGACHLTNVAADGRSQVVGLCIVEKIRPQLN
jgi:hypothetical protein